MADTICGLPFSAPIDLDLSPFDLKIALHDAVTCPLFEHLVFHFPINGGNGTYRRTDRRTDGRDVARMWPPSGSRIMSVVIQCSVTVMCENRAVRLFFMVSHLTVQRPRVRSCSLPCRMVITEWTWQGSETHHRYMYRVIQNKVDRPLKTSNNIFA